MAGVAVPAARSQRAARLHEVAARALTETLASGCSSDEFVRGFTGVDDEETRLLLVNMREQAQEALRNNVLVRAAVPGPFPPTPNRGRLMADRAQRAHALTSIEPSHAG